MSDHNNPQDPEVPEIDSGFEPEGDPIVVETKKGKKPNKSDEMKKNLSAVFGHGPGKLGLIFLVAFILVAAALAWRNLSGEPPVAPRQNLRMDVPTAPVVEARDTVVSAAEAARRNEQAAREAEAAVLRGETYQPGFDTNVVETPKPVVSDLSEIEFHVPGSQRKPLVRSSAPVTVPAGQSTGSSTRAAGQDSSRNSAGTNAQADQALQQEYQAALKERDKWVADIRNEVLKQAGGLLGGTNGTGGLNSPGKYSTISFATPKQATGGSQSEGRSAMPQAEKGPPLIKTGTTLYATLNAEMNTDDGNKTIATIRGGEWDGAVIIGSIEQTPNNVQLMFTTMAPQDGRPTMKIQAVALREEDSKFGMAEKIDHHTLARYTALGAASLLSGYGKAWERNIGTTVMTPGGGIAQTRTEPSEREIWGTTVGELGSSVSTEIKKGFNRPTTYSTPAGQGFGLFFLEDLHAQQQQ